MKWLWVALVVGCNGDKGSESGGTGDTGTPTVDTTTPPPVSTPDERIAAILLLTGDPTAGSGLYSMQCIACHGYDGYAIASGAADLAVRLPEITDEEVATALMYGVGNMDAYDFLANQDIADVMAYVRQAFDPGSGGTGG